MQRRDESLGEAHVVILGRGFRDRGSLRALVDEDQVEVAAVGELETRELAHAHDQELALFRGGGGTGSARGQLPPADVEGLLDAHLGNFAERSLGLEALGLLGEVEQRHVEGVSMVKQAQGVELGFEIVCITLASQSIALTRFGQDVCVVRRQLLAVEQQEIRVLEQGLDQARIVGEVARQKIGRPEQRRQPRHEFWAIEQQLEVETALAGPAEKAVEIVECPFGVRTGVDPRGKTAHQVADEFPDPIEFEQLRNRSLEKFQHALPVAFPDRIRNQAAQKSSSTVDLVLQLCRPVIAEVVHRPREPPDLVRGLGHAVELAFSLHLQTVFDAPQKEISLVEFDGDFRFQQTDGFQVAQGTLGRAISQLGNATCVKQLKRLGDELDVANAAGVDFDVERVWIVAPNALDLVFERANAVGDPVVHAGVVDRRGGQKNGVPAQGYGPGDWSGLHECGLLPGVGPGFVVIHQRVIGHDQRTLGAVGSQFEIDPVQKTVAEIRADELAELLGQTIEVDHRLAALEPDILGRGVA